jgi:multidrug efflux system membrane fusion protein
LVLLLALGGAVASFTACKRQNAYVAPPPPSVGVAHALRQEVTPYLEATGSLVAFNEVDLMARVEGFLQEIDYKDGAVARRGDTLFVVEPAPYQAKLRQAQASQQAAEAQVAQSDAEYKRQASLGSKEFSSQSTVDQALATRESNRANLENQKAGVTIAAINLGYTHVTAPFDGIVTAHLVSVGELVGVSGPTKLASIVQLRPIYVSFNISEQDVQRIRADLARRGLTFAELGKVPVEVGLMTEEGYPHSGTLDYAAAMVDPSTGTLSVRGVLSNDDGALLPGFFVRARVPMAAGRREALLVPDQVLGSNQSGSYLMVVNKDNLAEQRSVKIGQLVGALRVIEAGLEPDDQVVVTGLQHAIAGAKVAPEPAEIRSAATGLDGKS